MRPVRLSEPVWLAADTALGACSAALICGDQVLAHRWQAMERGHAEALAPMVEAIMIDAGIGFGAIDRLAVTTGPGTFTGQRVGLAFMRGLRIALKRPLTGVTTLAAMAAAAQDETGACTAAVLHDARRGEVYFATSGLGDELAEPQLLAFGAAIELISPTATPLALAGTAAGPAAEALADQGLALRLSTVTAPDALWVGRLARLVPLPDAAPRPLYLRPPDAKLPEART